VVVRGIVEVERTTVLYRERRKRKDSHESTGGAVPLPREGGRRVRSSGAQLTGCCYKKESPLGKGPLTEGDTFLPEKEEKELIQTLR